MALVHLFSVATILLVSTTLAIDQNVMKVEPGVSIGEHRLTRMENLGVVKGMRSCGGSAEVIQWRYATCLESQPICHVPTDGVSRTSQVDFIPSHNIEKPALRLIVRSNDGKINNVFDDGSVVADEELKKGNVYTVTATGGVTEELKGKDAVFQYIVYDLSNGEIEFCAEADLKYD